jgi:hypothetical protein
MKMKNKTTFQVLMAVGVMLAIIATSQAAIISVSTTAPLVDGADIANDNGAADAGGDQGHIWNNRPHQGQSFVTGSNAGGYTLNAVTMKNLNNTVTNAPTFNVVVGSLTTTGSPETLTQIGSTETGVAPNYVSGNYITFTFATPLTLNANTTYGFLWGSNSSGFVTVNNADDSTYTGGTAISSGDNNVPDLNNVLLRNVDRVFHVDMVEVPEPATIFVMMAAGLPALLKRRRRCRS